MSILDKIEFPKDLKTLNILELNELCDDIANLIHSTIHEEGGHYSSPLCVVDLTLALNFVYNTPKDKIIWDVGHQTYAHKIITGRKKEFKHLRQKDGISGFLIGSASLNVDSFYNIYKVT